jgi:D-xylose transport system substrate-binding protein
MVISDPFNVGSQLRVGCRLADSTHLPPSTQPRPILRRASQSKESPATRRQQGADLDAYISFDNERVGRLQATALENKLKQDGSPKGPIVMINGDPTDSNAHLFKQGASSVFSRDGVKIAKSYDTPDWERPHLTRHFGSANLN